MNTKGVLRLVERLERQQKRYNACQPCPDRQPQRPLYLNTSSGQSPLSSVNYGHQNRSGDRKRH